MKVFSFFTEPASYTLDLVDNVYDTMSIDYCFLNSISKAKTKSTRASGRFWEFFKWRNNSKIPGVKLEPTI